MGVLRAILGFISENSDVTGKLDPADVKAISAMLAKSIAAKSGSRAARTSLPAATQDLEANLRRVSVHTTAWLNILQGIFTLLEDEPALVQVAALRDRRPKPKAAEKKTNP